MMSTTVMDSVRDVITPKKKDTVKNIYQPIIEKNKKTDDNETVTKEDTRRDLHKTHGNNEMKTKTPQTISEHFKNGTIVGIFSLLACLFLYLISHASDKKPEMTRAR